MRHLSNRPCFFLILLSVSLRAAELGGSVVDPTHLPISGAAVILSCPDGERSAVTDQHGRFRFTVDASGVGCMFLVSHPHFAQYKAPIPVGAEPVEIQLQLASVKQTVTVAGNDPHSLPPATMGTVSLSGDQLKLISNNTDDLIQYVKLLAGVTGGSDAIYVDGLPSNTLPPVNNIACIIVNADPFSAEYSDADQTHIEIITKTGDRQLRVNFGAGALGTGGKNALAPNAVAKSSNSNWSASGPIPFLPLTFSAVANFAYTLTPLALLATPPPVLFPGDMWTPSAVSSNRHGSGSINLYFSPTESLHGHFSYFEARTNASDAGVGGLTLPQAGSDLHFRTRNLTVTFNKSWSTLLLRGGMVYTGTTANSEANSDVLGLAVAGAFTTGGAAMTAQTSQRSNWMWKAVVQSDTPAPTWTAGIEIERTGDASYQTPNPYGSFEFENAAAYLGALSGQGTGTYLVNRGDGFAHYASIAASPFFQRPLLKSRNLLITGGVRADYQSGYGVILSPRLSAATAWRKFAFRTGGGLFVRNMPDDVLLRVLVNDGSHLEQFIAQDVSLANFAETNLDGLVPLRTQLASGLTRPREWIETSSAERPLGKFDAGAGYDWMSGEHLLGSRRLPDAAGWVDLLESDRNSMMHRIHAQLGYKLKGQRLAAHYQWSISRDDTDGPFSFPADQNDIRAEWARSAGIPSHSATAVAMLQLPSRISANLTESWHGPAPYNITTGLDPAGDGLFTDRAGRLRNSGNGPSFNSVSLYASRRVALPEIPVRPRRRIFIRVGLQGSNLLNNRDYTGFGSVLGSPTFGAPLGALPGRSMRLWVTLD